MCWTVKQKGGGFKSTREEICFKISAPLARLIWTLSVGRWQCSPYARLRNEVANSYYPWLPHGKFKLSSYQHVVLQRLFCWVYAQYLGSFACSRDAMTTVEQLETFLRSTRKIRFLEILILQKYYRFIQVSGKCFSMSSGYRRFP